MSQQPYLRTADQTLVRELNLSLIMNRLHRDTTLSRAALAELTGLNKSTVSSLVNELIERKFVREVGIASNGIGRPSIQLQLNPEAGFIVSAEIGLEFIAVLCTSFTATVLWQYRETTTFGGDVNATLNRAMELLQQAVDHGQQYAAEWSLLGIAVGIPGLVERSTGTVLFSPNLRWEAVPLRSRLQQQFPSTPIYVDNEANMAALGEHFFGAAQGFNHILYLSIGVGLGGALVHDGQIQRGSTGFAGEFGHMTVDPAGELCACGNRGCWETLVGQFALFRLVKQHIPGDSASPLAHDQAHLSLTRIIDAVQSGDQAAHEIMVTVGQRLGLGIASLVNVVNPDLVLIGGLVSILSDLLIPAIAAEVNRRSLKWSAHATKLAAAHYGFDACVMGGVAVVYQTILTQPASA